MPNDNNEGDIRMLRVSGEMKVIQLCIHCDEALVEGRVAKNCCDLCYLGEQTNDNNNEGE